MGVELCHRALDNLESGNRLDLMNGQPELIGSSGLAAASAFLNDFSV